jgi:cation:H+ antiporter
MFIQVLHMIPPFLALFSGLALLVWGADRFVEGSASAARHLGVPSLLIGIVIVGFGTSAPEMVVSALASVQGKTGIALGNAYGSNIANIGLILGLAALIHPIAVDSKVLRQELPILAAVTLVGVAQAWDGEVTRIEAGVLLVIFSGLVAWAVWQGFRRRADALGTAVGHKLEDGAMKPARSLMWLILGFALLIGGSRLVVWGAVKIAQGLGIGDLIIGLTIVAVGTSLPELAASVIAARKKEHAIALGNILGSNLFNTLAVVGLAGVIRPMAVPAKVLSRDIIVMGVFSLSLFVIGFGVRGRPGRINRLEGAGFMLCYTGYTVLLVSGAF